MSRQKTFAAFCSMTKPQWQLLCDIVDGKRWTASDSCKPKETLILSRLIYEQGWSSRLVATEQGEALVKRIREQVASANS